MKAKWPAARTGVIAEPATSRQARQSIGAGAVEKVQVSSWPPMNWCRCRWASIASEVSSWPPVKLVSVPLSFHRKRIPKLAASELVSVPEQMVKRNFKTWRRKMFPRAGATKLPLIIKDFEDFLRQERNLKAEQAAGLKTLPQHPKVAPNPNAIENVWDLLQDRLLLTALVEMESRTDFIQRLRRTVTWMNTNARAHMHGLCRNQKKRAAEVLKLSGARCSF